MINVPLRFAALIRVSTEKQEKQGESLKTQASQIKSAVEKMGGVIVRTYGGQEHATPGMEKKQLKLLLQDAEHSPRMFDAIMVYDTSRWSRDNATSKKGLEILRRNEIRFFALTLEHNLHDPSAMLFLGMSAEIGEYQARIQNKKSLESCIERAKRIGAPTGGKPPFGRKWNKELEKWELIPEKQAMSKEAAERYLVGESLPKIAREFDINHSNLHKILTQKSGDKYEISWNQPDLKIQETVEIKIPPLLPQNIIQDILAKAKANRTYQHGKPKYKYLLSGFVFCAECGYSLMGSKNYLEKLYYRHARPSRVRKCNISPRPYVAADDVEHAVIDLLFDVFGNQAAMQKAIDKATPDQVKIQKLSTRYDRLIDQINKVEKGKSKILDLIVKELITESEADEKLQELKEQKAELDLQAIYINSQLGNRPTKEAIKELSAVASNVFRKRVSALPTAMKDDKEGMSWDDKRKLVEMVFNGVGADGRPHGVYIHAIEGQQMHRRKKWRLELHGHPFIDGDECVTQYASR